MTKNTSPTKQKTPSTSIPQTITQPTSQKNCNRFRLTPAITPNHASATRNKTHLTMQPARPATHDTISNPPLTPKTDQLQAITAHLRTPTQQPSTVSDTTTRKPSTSRPYAQQPPTQLNQPPALPTTPPISAQHPITDLPHRLSTPNPAPDARTISSPRHPAPSTTPLPYHQSPPHSPNTQQTLGKVLTTPAWTKRNTHAFCTDPIQPTLLPPLELTTKPIFSTPRLSLISDQLMQSIRQELLITKTLLDRLISMLPVDDKINQPSTPKNLFELLTDLPKINPKASLAGLSRISDSTKQCLQVQPTCNQYWRQPTSLEYIKTRNTQYLPILLRSLIQFTPPYAKDLLKVP